MTVTGSVVTTVQVGELVDACGLSAEELARACGVTPQWVIERLSAGVFDDEVAGGALRFGSRALARARRIAALEAVFDADPQLAALTADLIDEVARLRRMLQARSG